MTTTDIRPADLTAMPHAELVELFKTLDAPGLSEMVGEFDGTPLQQPNLFRSAVALGKVRNRLHWWKTKGFRQIDETSGRGYNIYRRAVSGRLMYRDPMTTLIAASHIDDRPAFQLDYRTFDTLNGFVNLVDDVRRVVPGLYLGFGMWGFTDRQRSVLQPFMLEATSRPYAGDIGTLRSEQRHGQPRHH
ncbi:hypothetical protein MINS_30800 [Mycolicibacterium insubricum]|jgi:hypothetical protein|uniref:Uncharacterized protein n=1 Tax=Mycolicibacterium insubricum TaxID=444597 RepID=A0A1X0DJI7_9MYCO|nr:hypothetical protein [Mycolicibacterium insubricum]MCB9441370.1 hypothetical protein [Mycolicibacterium sp.]MCV7081102.1 hypothetical protein [Mycolicibacterium insubricum]ORA72352.1 hypothetical protein BST26_05390 [Mycolicibacterium insubricum]BBZ67651.1 hypothetical protein MINS_30800 [Mycolicibacterium insubricum]